MVTALFIHTRACGAVSTSIPPLCRGPSVEDRHQFSQALLTRDWDDSEMVPAYPAWAPVDTAFADNAGEGCRQRTKRWK